MSTCREMEIVFSCSSLLFWIPKTLLYINFQYCFFFFGGGAEAQQVRKKWIILAKWWMLIFLSVYFLSRVYRCQSFMILLHATVLHGLSWKHIFAAYGKFSETLWVRLLISFILCKFILVLDLSFIPGPRWTNWIYFSPEY